MFVKMRRKGKKGMEIETLGWWIIAVIILIVLVVGYVILRQKDVSAIEFIKNLFRFGK